VATPDTAEETTEAADVTVFTTAEATDEITPLLPSALIREKSSSGK
jgi:hypothetical protein